MKKKEIPVTHAVRFLREKNILFEPYFYTYEEHGGTNVAARELEVREHQVIKTILFMTDQKEPLIVLMHGDMEVSTKNLARTIGVKNVEPTDVRSAERFTGYQFGGMSPFGTRNPIPVYIEKTIFNEEEIYINGGKRGFLVKLTSQFLSILKPIEVQVGINKI